MPLYESVIICRQDITKNQLDTIISEFKNIIESEKGEINRFEKGEYHYHIRHPTKAMVNKPH